MVGGSVRTVDEDKVRRNDTLRILLLFIRIFQLCLKGRRNIAERELWSQTQYGAKYWWCPTGVYARSPYIPHLNQ